MPLEPALSTVVVMFAKPVPVFAVTANTGSATTGISVAVSTTGSSGTNANYQPYITVYMWKRTA